MIPGLYMDKETKYWQGEYARGNLDDVDMPGEIMCVLDGTAERIGKSVLKWSVGIAGVILIALVLFCKGG